MSSKKPGGQPGHRGHHLQHVERPETVLVPSVERCEHCQQDLHTQPERRQVFDVPPRQLWITAQRVEEHQRPHASVRAPAHDGTGMAALAVSLGEGSSVSSARASPWLRDLLGVQWSAGSMASVVSTCHQPLAEGETQRIAALITARVLNRDETGRRVGTPGWWVHVCSPSHLTHAAAYPNRGHGAAVSGDQRP